MYLKNINYFKNKNLKLIYLNKQIFVFFYVVNKSNWKTKQNKL